MSDLLISGCGCPISRFLPAQEVIFVNPSDGSRPALRWIEAKSTSIPAAGETETPVFPSEAALQEALDSVQPAIEALCTLRWHVDGVAQFRGEQAPTHEEIGRLYAFIIDMDGRLEEARSYFKSIRKNLERLDYVRLLKNVDCDA